MGEFTSRVSAWLKRTPNRTFILFPVIVIVFEFLRRGVLFQVMQVGIPFLIWGYLQYRWCGRYRVWRGGGGPGLDTPPTRLVTKGPYAHTRNPMYLGHLIFLIGLAITFWSPLGVLIFVGMAVWLHFRILKDEEKLEQQFGEEFLAYKRRVRRWLPGLF